MVRFGKKILLNASPLLNVERAIGDAMDFTDRYMK